MRFPQWSSYGYRKSEQRGAKALCFEVGNLSVWFSYKTVVAFQNGGKLYVSENCWGPTTGRHLNAIDGGDKKGRLPRAVFERLLAAHVVPAAQPVEIN